MRYLRRGEIGMLVHKDRQFGYQRPLKPGHCETSRRFVDSSSPHIGADLLRHAHGMDPPLSWVFVPVSSEPSPATTHHSQPRAGFVTGPQYSLNTLHHG